MNASDITALLDATSSLTSAGIHAESSIFATPSTAADINRAVMEWCNANAATIDVNPELRSSAVRAKGWIVAVIFQPRAWTEEETRVVDVPLEVTS